jgi:CelD/BcsL family acetyltransferase involved in cellulose biosynthesis
MEPLSPNIERLSRQSRVGQEHCEVAETVTTIVKIHDRIEPLVTEWERLAQHLGASPFLWPGWVEAWWHAFGTTGQLQILTAYQDGHLAGVLPLRRLRGALRSTTNDHTPLFGFLVANELAAHKLAQALFSQNARRIDLSLLLPDDTALPLARAAADAERYRVFTESIEEMPYVAIDGMSWDSYEKGLGKNLRGDVRRRRRRLEEEGDLTLDVLDGTQGLDELLQEGFRVEGSGWKGAEGTSIDAHPTTRRFYTEVAHWATERGWLRLAFLRLDGRALAFDYCLEFGGTHYMLKTGYDPAYERFSPGKVLRHLMLARAFSEGLASYEFLGRFDPWKQKWTNTCRKLQSVHMFAPTALGFLDRTAYAGAHSALKHAKNLARSPVFPERGYRLLKRGHSAWHRALERRRMS